MKKHQIKDYAAKGGQAIISKRGSEYMREIGRRGRAKQIAEKKKRMEEKMNTLKKKIFFEVKKLTNQS